MAAFIFVGNGKSDPSATRLFGYEFTLNGAAVEVDDESAKKLAGNSHFTLHSIDLIVQNSALPADKNELEKFARDRFGVEIDKRKSLSSLQKQVQELIDGNTDAE